VTNENQETPNSKVADAADEVAEGFRRLREQEEAREAREQASLENMRRNEAEYNAFLEGRNLQKDEEVVRKLGAALGAQQPTAPNWERYSGMSLEEKAKLSDAERGRIYAEHAALVERQQRGR
jgi:hypothetical protein